MIITETHNEKIAGVLNCYDRINIKCTAGTFGYTNGNDKFTRNSEI